MKLLFQRLRPDAKIPTAGSEYAAGYDLYACGDDIITIPAHETVMIHTGLKIAVPNGYFGAVFARSGLAFKLGLRPSNCVGVCDSDYRGEWMIGLHNDTDTPASVSPGERVAQLVVLPCLKLDFEECEQLPETLRGEGGFGSTGTH